MKTIDFSKIEVLWVDRTTQVVDTAKRFAQAIYANTQDVAEANFALELHKNPVVELTEENKAIIKANTEKYHLAYLKLAINKLIDESSKE